MPKGLSSALCVFLIACHSHVFVSAEPARRIVLQEVRVFDAPNATLRDGLFDVIVEEARIVAVESHTKPIAGALSGGIVIPGLIDVHTHVPGGSAPPWLTALPNIDENLGAFLYAGVTTALDLGGMVPHVFELRAAIAKGDKLGPRLFVVGPVFTAPGGHPAALVDHAVPWWIRWYAKPRMVREIASEAEAKAAVDALVEHRPDFLKIVLDDIPVGVPRLQPEVIRALVAAAHAHGLRAVAHVGHSTDVVTALEAGIDAFVHGVYVESLSAEAKTAFARRPVPVVPTVSVFDRIELFGPRRAPAFTPLERATVDPKILASLANVPTDYDGSFISPWVATLAAGHGARRDNIRTLRAQGVTILAGSDSPNAGHFPGAGLHLELDALVEAGFTPAEALRVATWENARFLEGADPSFGVIAPGKRADLVVLDATSLDRVDALHAISRVIAGGRLLVRTSR